MCEIAFIDDCKEDQKIISHVVSMSHLQGHSNFYNNLTSALEESKKFAIIFTDALMPDGFGVDVVRQLRKKFKDAYIVVVTGAASGFLTGKTQKNLIDSGANDVIAKDDLTPDLIDFVMADYEGSA